MMRRTSSLLILFLILILIDAQQVPRILFVNDQLDFKYGEFDTPEQFYQLSMPKSQDGSILLITAITKAKEYLQIFVDFGSNGTAKKPTSSHNKEACYDLSLDTCPINLEQYRNQSVIYFTIVSENKKDYTLQVFVSNISSLNNNTEHTLNFGSFTSSIFSLTPSLFSVKEVDILIMYDSFSNSLSSFSIRAGKDELPTSPVKKLQGSSLGAFTRIIRFLNISESTECYIIVTAFKNAVLDLTINVPTSQLKNKNNYLGQVSDYESEYQVTSLYYTQGFPINITEEIHYEVQLLMGSGYVNGYYCGQESPLFSYNNEKGIPAHFFISVEDRHQCQQFLEDKGQGLLIQQLIIKFEKIPAFLGYSINFYLSKQNTKEYRELWLDDLQYGAFPNYPDSSVVPECDSYQINWSQSGTTLQMLYSCDSCTVKFDRCVFKNSSMACDEKILDNENKSFLWTTKNEVNYMSVCPNLVLSNVTQYNTYSIGYIKDENNIKIFKLDFLHHAILDMNHVDYYHILPLNDQQKQNTTENSTFEIIVRTVNGDINLFTSLTDKYPNMKEMYTEGKNVQFWWTQEASYLASEADNGIYIGISGRAQSFYTIEAYIDNHEVEPQPQPEPQKGVLADGANQFSLKENGQTILVYKSHIIPYNASISPFPSCIQIYKSEKQIGEDRKCLDQMPTHTLYPYDTLVLRILNSEKQMMNYTVTITVPELTLKQFSYVSIACIQACYTFVKVEVPENFEQMSIKHYNGGVIEEIVDDGNISSKIHTDQIFNIKCESGKSEGCIVVLNASLPYGGMMFIENANISSQEVSYSPQIQKIQKYNPLSLLFPINEFSENNNLLLLSESAPLDIYYTIFSINISETNTINYHYNSPEESPHQEESQPFQPFSIVRIGQKMSCSSSQLFCLATVTLFPDLSILPIPDGSTLKFSSNSYTYHIMLNSPYLFRSIFGLSRFQYNAEGIFYATVESLSNCDATIYGLDTKFGEVSNGEGNVSFQIQSREDCEYMVTLTQCPYRTILSGIEYHFKIQGSEMSLYFVHRHEKRFRIYASSQVSIYAATIENQNCQLSTKNQYTRDSGSTQPLLIDSTEIVPYVIVLKIDPQAEQNFISIAVIEQESMLTLLPNNIASILIPSNYNYDTNQHIQICMLKPTQQDSEELAVQLIVSQDQKSFFDQTITLKNSQISCFPINNISTNEISSYNIELKGQSSWIQIQVIEKPSSIPLYPSVAFKNRIKTLKKQCYRTSSEYTQNQSTLTYTILFENSLGKEQFILESDPPTSFQIAQITEKSIQVKKKTIQDNLWCFLVSTNIQMDYYITLQGKDMANLVQDELKYHMPSTNNSTYNLYQYLSTAQNIATQGKQIQKYDYVMMKIINCGDSSNAIQVVGSKNYEEIENGRTSDIHNYWSNGDMILGAVEAPSGYYYFGVQTNTSIYSMKTLYSTSLSVPSSQWKLSNKSILTSNSNSQSLIVQLPTLQSGDSEQNKEIIYTLLIANSSLKFKYKLSVLGKCPQLQPEAFTHITIKQLKNPSVPVFEIPTRDLPLNISLFAFAEAQLPNAYSNLSFYYEPTTYQITPPDPIDGGGSGILSWIIVLAIIFLVLFGLRYLYLIWRRRKNRAEIEFEMSETQRQQNENRQNNRGYGEFVDEAQ